MKKLILLALTCAIASAYLTPSRALADVYSCELLQDSSGNRVYGGPAYAIQIKDGQVTLMIRTGGDMGGPIKTTRVPMQALSETARTSIYEALGVRAKIEKDERGETLDVSIYVRDNTAQCLPLNSEE